MIIIVWIILTIILAWYGGYRKIGFWGAFFLSLLLSPLIGLIAVALSEKLPPPGPKFVDDGPEWPPKHEVSNISVADEIAKFKKLLDEGLIDDAEFQRQKSKLLG